uniref:Uncharacterized protein n=1 Tax=Glossina austeni TaxID=7395 RepID=A0A1A9UZH3_GLOAU
MLSLYYIIATNATIYGMLALTVAVAVAVATIIVVHSFKYSLVFDTSSLLSEQDENSHKKKEISEFYHDVHNRNKYYASFEIRYGSECFGTCGVSNARQFMNTNSSKLGHLRDYNVDSLHTPHQLFLMNH